MREKLKNIEILRFIFIIQIVLMHLTRSSGLLKLLSSDVPLFKYFFDATANGYVGVDYYFIIAGFFVRYTYRDIHCWRYVMHKMKRLLPTMLAALVIIFLLSTFYSDIEFNWFNAFYTITFTASFMPSGTGYFWFVGPLFWSSLFYFYTLKYYDKKHLNVIFSIVIICSYSLLINNSSNNFWNVRPHLFNFLNMGMLRGLAGMGIGYFIAMFYTENVDKLRNVHVSFPHRVLITCIEAALLLFIIYYGSLCTFVGNPMLAIFAFMALFFTFLLKWGFISKFLDNGFSVFLGKYVYTIYVMESAMHHYLKHVISSMPHQIIMGGGGMLLLIIIGHIGASVIIYHCLEKLKMLYEKYCFDNRKG